MSKKLFLKKTYADAVKGIANWEFGPGESVVKPEMMGFPYRRQQTLVKSPTAKTSFKSSKSTPRKTTKSNSASVSPSSKISKRTIAMSTPPKIDVPSPLSSAESPLLISSSPESVMSLPKHLRKQLSEDSKSPFKESSDDKTNLSPIVIDDTSEEEFSPIKKRRISPVKRQLFASSVNYDTDDSLPDLEEDKGDACQNTPSEFNQLYENDPLLPIYKRLSTGIKTKNAITLLLKKLRPEQLAKNIPTEIRENVSFVYSVEEIGHWKNALCDGMGRWNQMGKETHFFIISEENHVKIVNKKEAPETSLKVIRRKYSNSSYRKLHRIVILLENPLSKVTLNQMFVQYYFEGPEQTVSVLPHGNSKCSAKYQRTNETTKQRIEELCSTKSKPKDIFHTILEDQGGINNVQSGAFIARDRQQITNFKRKIATVTDPILECSDLAKQQEKKHDRFLRDVRSAPEFTMFMCTDRQLKDIDKFCTDNKCTSVLGVDTTFNIGQYYVTITTYRHLMLTNVSGIEPVMIGPILLHQRKSFDSYFKLSSTMLQECPNLKTLKVFGTDGDENLANAFQVCFPDSEHLLCDLHMMDNIERKLQKLQIKGKTAKQYIHDIFGNVIDETKIKGLVDCLSENEFDEKMETLEDEWKNRHINGHTFLDYFIEYKMDLIKQCMAANIRSKCGLGFPPKPYTQNGNECINSVIKADIFSENNNKKKIDPFDFVKIAEKVVKRQENEIKLSLIGKGEYKLKAEYQHLSVPEQQFWKKSAMQRESVFKRMQCEPLKKYIEQDKPHYLYMSVSEEVAQIRNIPPRILTDIFQQAGDLLENGGSIVILPGTKDGKTFLVANKDKSTDPYMVKYSSKSSVVSCEKKCPRWSGFGFCHHSVAVANYLGILKTYIICYRKRLDQKEKQYNLTELSNTNMPTNRGKKSSKATQRRRGKSNKVQTDVLHYSTSNTTTVNSSIAKAQPFHLTFLAGLIRKCYGCDQHFHPKHRCPPNDLILKRFDYRVYISPQSKQKKQSRTLQNTYFHFNTDCVRRHCPTFEMKDVIIHNEISLQLNDGHKHILRRAGVPI